MPNAYKLEPIYELFVNGYIAYHTTNLGSLELNTIYNNLITTAENYCEYLASEGFPVAYCGTAPDDVKFVQG